MDLSILMQQLTGRDNAAACGAAQILAEESRRSDALSPYFGQFLDLLASRNSLARNRALALIAANAQWDEAGLLDAALDTVLAHITDEKPITARQCIKALPEIAAAKPALAERIRAALLAADPSRYADSMRPLVEKDIAAALAAIAGESC